MIDPAATPSATVGVLQDGAQLRHGMVVRAEDDRTLLDIGGAQVWAVPATVVTYRPNPADEVLAIGQGDDWYIIGVLRGTGGVSIEAVGDVSVRSLAGSVQITAPREVAVRSARISILSQTFDTIATTARQVFHALTLRVSGRSDERIGQRHTTVRDESVLQAGRVIENAREEVKINGSTIHLG